MPKKKKAVEEDSSEAPGKGRLPLAEYKKLCNKVLERDKWRCRVCQNRNDLHCHHIVFRSQGGEDTSRTLVTLCQGCHSAIHKPHPRTGAGLSIQGVGGAKPDADWPLSFRFLNGWKPGRAT